MLAPRCCRSEGAYTMTTVSKLSVCTISCFFLGKLIADIASFVWTRSYSSSAWKSTQRHCEALLYTRINVSPIISPSGVHEALYFVADPVLWAIVVAKHSL